jgi:LppP/LprE lipoprotein
VQAERDRRRLPKRGPVARWSRRIAGLLATAAFIGVGVVSAQMIMPDKKAVSAAPAATQTPAAKKKKAAKKTAKAKPKHRGLTKVQRAARTAAVAEVRHQGYTARRLSDYDVKASLRVLIGRPVGDAAGGYRAFFFGRSGFLGKDSFTPSTELRLAKQRKSSVTLTYGVYKIGDSPGHPSGSQRVTFKLVGTTVTPQEAIPLGGARFQRLSG